MNLNDIKKTSLARKRARRIGRGQSSGSGGTAGRGMKGQRGRSGNTVPFIFEGGSMPLVRKIPKRGFNNAQFQQNWVAINVEDLNQFNEGHKVTPEELVTAGIIDVPKNSKFYVKLLANGELKTKKLQVKVHKVSESAKKKLEEAQGSLELLNFSRVLKKNTNKKAAKEGQAKKK